MNINILYTGSKEYIMNMPKKVIFIIIGVILLIIIGIGGYFYWANLKKSTVQNGLDASNTAEDITNSATRGVLPSMQTNPLEDKPDVNPADKANPFKDIKTNPF